MRIKKVLSFVLTMIFVFRLVGTSSTVFADPTPKDTIEDVNTQRFDNPDQNVVPSAPLLEDIDFDSTAVNTDSTAISSDVVNYQYQPYQQAYPYNVSAPDVNYQYQPYQQAYPYNVSTPDVNYQYQPYDQTYQSDTPMYLASGPYQPYDPCSMQQPVCEVETTQTAPPNSFIGTQNNPYRSAAYQAAAKAKLENEKKLGFFNKTKDLINRAIDYIKPKAHITPNTALDTVTGVTVVAGLYGLNSLRHSDNANVLKKAGAVIAVVGTCVGIDKAVEFAKNEWNYYQKGKDLPKVAKRKRFSRFEKNIVTPTIKAASVVAVAGGLYFSPRKTLKLLSPIISSGVVKNRMDKYWENTSVNSCVSETIGFGVGSLISPVSTTWLAALRIVRLLVGYSLS